MIKLWVLVGHVMAANSNSQDICAQMILALNSIGRNAKLSSRLRFMAQDTLELAANNVIYTRVSCTKCGLILSLCRHSGSSCV